jgi:hypothetical protein
LALIFSEAKKINILVPENGTVSVNFPLSPSRRSACSTRTTHPRFVNSISDLWSDLQIDSRIENPYRFKTKGEMVKKCKNQNLLQSVFHLSNSCGKRGHRAHWDDAGTHCGICMPCLYRRASVTTFKDNTDYGNDMNDLELETKKGQDVAALLEFLKFPISKNDIKFELIANGLNEVDHLYDYINLIKRTRSELKDWINSEGDNDIQEKAGL